MWQGPLAETRPRRRRLVPRQMIWGCFGLGWMVEPENGHDGIRNSPFGEGERERVHILAIWASTYRWLSVYISEYSNSFRNHTPISAMLICMLCLVNWKQFYLVLLFRIEREVPGTVLWETEMKPGLFTPGNHFQLALSKDLNVPTNKLWLDGQIWFAKSWIRAQQTHHLWYFLNPVSCTIAVTADQAGCAKKSFLRNDRGAHVFCWQHDLCGIKAGLQDRTSLCIRDASFRLHTPAGFFGGFVSELNWQTG